MNSVSKPATTGKETDPTNDPTDITDPMAGISHLAVRDDGRLMLSTEDCEDRDLSGRELVTFVLLTREETIRVRQRASDGFAYTAARTANDLPKLKKGKP